MTRTTAPTRGDTDTELDPYLSSTEVALELSISRGHAARLMREGVIPGVVDLSTRGRATLRIRRSALMAWIDSRAL